MNPKEKKKGMSAFDFFMLSFGSMVGLGWLVSSPLWVGNAGGLGAIIACFIVMLMIIPIGFCYIELTAGLKVSGAEFAFANKCLGKWAGFAAGWSLLISYLFMQPWMCISIITVLNYLFPWMQTIELWTIGGYTMYLPTTIIVLLCLWFVVFTQINGIEWTKRLQNVFTTIQMITIAIFLIGSLTAGSPSNFFPLFNENIGAAPGIFLALGSIAFFLTGFDTVPKMLEEARSDLTYANVGRVMTCTIIFGGVFYATVCVAIGFLAGGDISTMLGHLPAVRVFGEVTGVKLLEYIVLFGGITGITTSINGFMIAGVKNASFFCKSRFLPESWGDVDKTNTPKRAILFWGVFTTVFVLMGRALLVPLIILQGVLLFFVWALVCLSCIRFRKNAPDAERPYKVPGGSVTMWIGFLISATFVILSLVPGTILSIDTTAYMILIAGAVLGAVVYFGYSRRQNILTFERHNIR